MSDIKIKTVALLAAITTTLCLTSGVRVMPVHGDTIRPSAKLHAATFQAQSSDNPPLTSGVCRQEKFALFEGPNIGDIGADTSCPSVINAIRTAYLNGGKPLTSKSYYYLSELAPFLGKNYAKLPSHKAKLFLAMT